MGHSFVFSAHRIRVLGALGILGVVLATTGCDALFPDREAEAIDRATFIEVQVELRLATGRTGEISQARRDSILTEKGVSDEHLAAFLTVHGSDDEFMTELWAEVDRKVLEAGGLDPEQDPDRLDPPEAAPPSP